MSWLTPFLVSFVFYDRSGALLLPQPLFKSLMVVLSGAVGATLFVWVFRTVRPSLAAALVIGLYWMALNLLLDLLILVPISGVSMTEYAFDIGLRYLLIPIMGVAIGVVADTASRP